MVTSIKAGNPQLENRDVRSSLNFYILVPDNITILHLPAKAPELNPVENIWQFMRDNWLSNRIFKSYGQILALCCQAWNKRIDQPWAIMSIGMRTWALIN